LPTGCKSAPATVEVPRTHQVVRHVVHVYHTEDGSTAYHGSDGFWYWYILSVNTGSSSTSTYPTSSASGSWSRQTYAPGQVDSGRGKVVHDDEEELHELEAETASTLLEDPELEQVEVTEPDAPEAAPTTESEPQADSQSEPSSEPASEPSSDSSSSSDSGSSDSGGGSSD
jgi:hypothetical protein